jgi:hypothetical protein
MNQHQHSPRLVTCPRCQCLISRHLSRCNVCGFRFDAGTITRHQAWLAFWIAFGLSIVALTLVYR